MRTLALILLLPTLLLGCKSELVCADGETDCGGRCVSLQLDPANCGACGAACGAGTACGNGTCSACATTCTSTRGCAGEQCLPDLFVGCPASSELMPRAADLSPAGAGRPVSSGLTALTASGGLLYAADGFPAATVDIVPMDPALATRHVALSGSDLEGVAVHAGVAFVSNASAGTLVLLDGQSGALLDELPLPGQQAGPNPHGIAFVGSTAYVALTGFGPGSGQAVAVVDLAGLPACSAEAAPPACGAGDACDAGRHCVAGLCRLPCATVAGSVDLAVSGSADAPGLPFPGKLLAVGTKVYATLANLKLATVGGFSAYVEPAGPGRLAVLDTAAGNAVSFVNLGSACGNPGGLALHGTTLWVSCGSFGFSAAWPGRLVPVDLAAGNAVGSALGVGGVVPNGVTFCGGRGYVPDQASGVVLPFDPVGRSAGTPVDVCPVLGYAYVADLACAP